MKLDLPRLRRRNVFMILAAFLLSLYLLYIHPASWQHITAPRSRRKGGTTIPDTALYSSSSDSIFTEPKIASTSPYPPGTLKPPGSNYTTALVLATTKSQDTTWVITSLSDLISSKLLLPKIYTVDDPSALLRPKINKGHEAMVYLSYLIDNYDDLPDIMVFMHGHQFAWHNNDLLDLDSAEMVRRLRVERVASLGYMNLRCHWNPGCPAWILPLSRKKDGLKKEEEVVAAAWGEIFPRERVPEVLGQACCSQFAVSRERVLSVGRERFVGIRAWLEGTELEDELSGRVLEWVWQYIFTQAAVDCPSMSACYCGGFGVCFGTPERFDLWFELRWRYKKAEGELLVWREQMEATDEARRKGVAWEDPVSRHPEPGKGIGLEKLMGELVAEMDAMREDAFTRGKDPRNRALESG